MSQRVYIQLGKAGQAERYFWSKVTRKDSGCWEWDGPFCRPPVYPYGRFKHSGKEKKAHRVCWEIVFGPIPKGLWVLHKCDNPKCVSLFHIYVGTPKRNTADMLERHRRPDHRGPNQRGNGEEHPNHKLTATQVAEIRASELSQRQLASEYGVSKPTIQAILKGETWKHV
jgi:hypothetical protein